MKRFTLTIMTFCFALMVMAEPIGKNAALYTAKSYMLAKGKNINQSQKPFKASPDGTTSTDNQQDAYYYVFNAGNDGGYVIVSGDDRIEPILGYVDHGSFDPNNIPENMRSWLQLYADQIKFVIDNNIQPDDPIIKKRNKVAGTKHSVAEMLTTRWNQGKPYNITCPPYYTNKDNDEHYYPATGCTATAMAQVMYFYRYPDKTKAIIPAHSNTYTLKNGTRKTVTAPAIPRNTIIDWDNMRDTYSWEDNHVGNAQDTAVANLMLYCGQSVNMGWGPSSGANFSAEAYNKYFGFDARAYVGERRDYSIDEWFEMLYHEIEQGYPVLFSGFSSGGGHAFVLDGFDGENLFHLNWGWGGGSNGWFLVSILNPGDNSGIGASSSSDGYSMGQRALFDLRVPGTPKDGAHLSISNVSISNYTVSATFTNKTGASGSFNVGLVTMEEDGSLSLVGSKLTINGMANGTSQTKTFNVKNRLPEGTFRLSPASKMSKSDEWVPKYVMNVENSQYVVAVVDSLGALNLHFNNPSNESLSIDTIVFPGTRIAGKEQEVKVTYRNTGKQYFNEIRMFASTTDEKVYSDSRSMVAVRSNELVDVSYFFTPDTTGIYNLWFCTGSDGSGEIGSGTMEVITEAEAEMANLSVSSYTITNSVNNVAYGKRLIGKASIKNNKNTDFIGKISLQIWTQYGGSGSAWSGSTQTYEVNIMAGSIASVDFDFGNLAEGNKYYISASVVSPGGSMGRGGVWDSGGWSMGKGILTWKSDGTVAGQAYSSSLRPATTVCGLFADCSGKISRVTPIKNNPNVIYAFPEGMAAPKGLDASNAVYGKHADRINLVNEKAYYIPTSFVADNASFTYTFPETEDGTKWHAITMPFRVDSIFLDDEYVSLDDTLNHFWIYEFTREKRDGSPIFAPAKELREGTGYIIAGDAIMAGRSIVFRSTNVPFYKTGSDKMVVSSHSFLFHGNTYAPKVQDCYMLNEAGTAFEYTSTATSLSGMEPYFTTHLSEETRPESIVLPEIPVVPVRTITLDETDTHALVAGRYDVLTLKRPFEAGWNTICLPFKVKDIEAVFGQGAKAYEYCGFVENELDVVIVEQAEAGLPYVLYLPNAISEDIILNNIRIDEQNTYAGYVYRGGTYMRGTYAPIQSPLNAKADPTSIFVLNLDGTGSKYNDETTSIRGFQAFFELPSDAENVMLHPYDDPTGIDIIQNSDFKIQNEIYNIAGQMVNGKLSNGKLPRGIYIVNGKKILK